MVEFMAMFCQGSNLIMHSRESQGLDALLLKIDDDPSIQAVHMHGTSLQVLLALSELDGSQWTIRLRTTVALGCGPHSSPSRVMMTCCRRWISESTTSREKPGHHSNGREYPEN